MGIDKTRIVWVDVFKAFMVFFVAFGHTAYDFESAGSICNMYVLSFHVSGFFFVSGYLFSRKKIKFWDYLKGKFKALMIPYYIFAFMSFAIYIPLSSIIYSNLDVEMKSTDILGNFLGIFYANGLSGYMKWNLSLWFIPCYFIVLSLFFLIVRLIDALEKKMSFNRAVLTVMPVLITFAFLDYYVFKFRCLPFGLEVSFYMLPVMLFGFWLRRVISLEKFSKKTQWGLAIVLIILGGAITLSTQNYVSVVSTWYGNLVIFYLSVIPSLLGYMFLSNQITAKPLVYMGQNTISVLLMHKFPIMVFQLLFEDYMKSSGVYNVGLSLIITTVACILSLACGEVLTKIAPFILGKKRS